MRPRWSGELPVRVPAASAPPRSKRGLPNGSTASREQPLAERSNRCVTEHPPLGSLLGGIAEAAPYLWDLVDADPARLVRLLTHDPDDELAALLAATRGAAAAARGSAAVMRILRRMKAEAALLVALADIGGVWPVARVTAALTDVAETALGAAVRYLLAEAAGRGKLALPDPQNPEDWLRLRRAGDGKNGRLRAEFLQRHRPHGVFRS